MRTLKTAPTSKDGGAVLLGATATATALVLSAPTFGIQLALLFGTLLALTSLVMARAGGALNAAWVILGAIYLIDPLGHSLVTLGLPVPIIAVVAVAPVGFVASVLWNDAGARERLARLVPLAVLAGLAGISLLWSLDPDYGLRKLSLWVLAGLIPTAYILVLASPARPAAWRFLAVAAFVFALALLAYGSTASLYPGRLIMFDANPIWLARAVFIGALITMFGPIPWRAKIVLLPVMVIAGLLTDSLGPTVGLAVGAAAGIAEALRSADRSDRRVQLGWAALVLAVLVGLAAFVGVAGSGPSYLAPIANDPNVSSRAMFLDAALRSFLSAPVLGNGLGSFTATGLDNYPHNIIAEVGAELGLLGLALLGIWVAMALRGASRSPLLVALVAATGVFALFSGNLSGNTEFWLCTGLAVAARPLGRRPGTPTADA